VNEWQPASLRIPYLRFANVVARAVREVKREGEFRELEFSVIAYSVDASIIDTEASTASVPAWGEFWPPDGPIVLYQAAYETMPDQENYYRQIKAVVRHEFRHAIEYRGGHVGHDNDPSGLIYARVRRVDQ